MNAPRTWPKSSDSSSVLGQRAAVDGDERLLAPQATARGCARATSSLPVPDSPVSSIVLLVRQTVSTSRNTSSIGPLRPMMPGKALVGDRLAQDVTLVAHPARVDELPHLQRDEIDVAERLFEQRGGPVFARAPPFVRIAGEVRGHHDDDGVGCELRGSR